MAITGGALAELKLPAELGGGPTVLYNMGLTYQALFRYGEAVDTSSCTSWKPHGGQGLIAERKEAVRKGIAELASSTTHHQSSQ